MKTNKLENPIKKFSRRILTLVAFAFLGFTNVNAQTQSCDAGFQSGDSVDCTKNFNITMINNTDYVPLSHYAHHRWDFGDGTIEDETNMHILGNYDLYVYHTYSTNGQYLVKHYVSNIDYTCEDSTTMIVSVSCNGDSTITNSNIGYNTIGDSCLTELYLLDSTNLNAASVSWDIYKNGFLYTSLSGHIVYYHFYQAGTYGIIVNYLDWNGMSHSDSSEIYISCDSTGGSGGSEFDAEYAYGYTGCNFNFQDQSIGNPTNWYWYFGDGDVSNDQNPTHQYAEPGYYSVWLAIWDDQNNYDLEGHVIYVASCNPSDSGYVDSSNVAADCYADFDMFTYQDSSVNCICPVTYIYNLSVGDDLNYTWYWGDGSSSTGEYPEHSYAEAGTYTICLFISNANGCSDSICVTGTFKTGSTKDVLVLPIGTKPTSQQVIHAGVKSEKQAVSITGIAPNPANTNTTITYELKEATVVSISVLDMLGNEVATVTNENVAAGKHSTSIDVTTMNAAIYFVKVTAGSTISMNKMMVNH